MSKIFHLPNMSYVSGRIKFELSFERLSANLKRAQWWLGEQVLADCRSIMPLRTGSLIQRSHTEDNGRRVVFPGPYSRYQYMGKAMVDSETGRGPARIPTGDGGYILRFKKGAKLVATDRPLKYSRPEAVPKWFEAAKVQNLEHWIKGAKMIARGETNVR